MAAPQRLAQNRRVHDHGRRLRVVQDGQIRGDEGMAGIRLDGVEVGPENVIQGNGAVRSLEQVVELLGDLEEGVVAANGAPASVQSQRPSEGNRAAQHLGDTAAHGRGVDVDPRASRQRLRQPFDLIHALRADDRLVIGQVEGAFRPLFFKPREGVVVPVSAKRSGRRMLEGFGGVVQVGQVSYSCAAKTGRDSAYCMTT